MTAQPGIALLVENNAKISVQTVQICCDCPAAARDPRVNVNRVWLWVAGGPHALVGSGAQGELRFGAPWLSRVVMH